MQKHEKSTFLFSHIVAQNPTFASFTPLPFLTLTMLEGVGLCEIDSQYFFLYLPRWHCRALDVENWLSSPEPIAEALESLKATNKKFRGVKSARRQILKSVTQRRDLHLLCKEVHKFKDDQSVGFCEDKEHSCQPANIPPEFNHFPQRDIQLIFFCFSVKRLFTCTICQCLHAACASGLMQSINVEQSVHSERVNKTHFITLKSQTDTISTS